MSGSGFQPATSTPQQDPLGPFVRSKVFTNLFAHGMELVEETATYLDNGGRRLAKALERDAAMTYAGVSMKLTTRLMQIASWLLVLRAVRDGDMSTDEARDDKYRIVGSDGRERGLDDIDVLPEVLRDLIEQTDTLYARISRLDRDLFQGKPVTRAIEADAQGQLQALKRAFGE